MLDDGQRLVVIGVSNSTFFPGPLRGTGCSYYHVGRSHGGMLGWNAVRGTSAEQAEWRAAADRFYGAVGEAENAYGEVVRGRARRLPGARRRKERAAGRFHEAMAAAEEDYAPVRAEIERRLAVEEEQARRDREERERRWEAERAEEKARRQAAKALAAARKARCYELARRRVWEWAVVEDEARGATEIRVGRHDVRAGQPLPASSRRSERPLTARSLERKLLGLRDELDLTDVRWEQAAMDRVVAECSTPDDPVPFEVWWATVTARHWHSSRQVPPPSPPPSPHPPDGPGRAYGHSGSDYGGIGGDFGGGGYGGGFSGGFGGGY
ncbi:hypothetical protein [Streptomyces sp. 35G-GA-8]|uniref:hypothetical protein n=1 Tax=Streptomyces sp. 35G-GA-8 TaxID=2939434 RepID=UPI00201FB07E|nr:hypothetical protein [Streptomyces sp. 35G-GA-8]MCL7380519.1 hypothetical protein [Streptomyces sp. 35G-GA-8]